MMNMDILKSFTEQMQGFASPLTRYNQLLASNWL
jgi:phasin family protein